MSTYGQAARVLDDYLYGRDFIDPSHVKDGGVTKDHTRQWKVLQELQVQRLSLQPLQPMCHGYVFMDLKSSKEPKMKDRLLCVPNCQSSHTQQRTIG